MKTYLFDPLVAVCSVCEKRIGLTQEWTRSVSGIRHAFCPEPEEMDGEWVTEYRCRACGEPMDADSTWCDWCQRKPDVAKHREWVCRRHGNCCFCFPTDYAGTDRVPWNESEPFA